MFGGDTLFLQRFLKVAGFDPGPTDGSFGVKTAAALANFEDAADAAAMNYRRLDSRSETCIRTLLPEAQKAARHFMDLAQAINFGADIKIICGTRTYREQAAIFAQGRTRPGKIVTKAGQGQSNHNFGLAWDIGFFDGDDYVDDPKPYRDLGERIAGEKIGVEWGGAWRFIDMPHFQIVVSVSLADVRRKFEAGEAYA